MTRPQIKPHGIPVAIVGIGCRFPGGVSDADSFWRFLVEGRDAITEIPPDRIDVRHYFDPRPATPGRMIVRGAVSWTTSTSLMPNSSAFRRARLNVLIRPRDFYWRRPGRHSKTLARMSASLMVRGPASLSDNGSMTSNSRVFRDPDEVDFYMAQGSGQYAASGRISYVLGLRGPSLTIDTACSSSLVALHLAVRSIRSGECNMTLAGGANIILQPHINIAYSQSRTMSADGRCKFGDASGDGYVRSEGVALVALKALDRAVADGDRIYAVIRGSAINNDGRSSGSMGTPSQFGQEELLRSAYRDAGLSGAEVDYVEAHGTGTRAGDPVEFGALAAVLGEGREPGRQAFVGSLKTNFGHTEAGAGVAGLIKIALALHHDVIPPSLHLNTPNPLIPWADLSLAVPRTLVSWPGRDGPHVAGVSGLTSGTNAHVVSKRPPPRLQNRTSFQPGRRRRFLFPRRARGTASAGDGRRRICSSLTLVPNLYDVCWTAATRRTSLEHRAAFVADDRPAMVDSLRRYAGGSCCLARHRK